MTGEVEAHGVVVEKMHFQSKPGLYVTANLYRPKDAMRNDKSLPAIVYVCGHSWKGRDGNKTAFQDHGFWFANNGYVCIILDTLQLGEIPGVHHGTYGDPVAARQGQGPNPKIASGGTRSATPPPPSNAGTASAPSIISAPAPDVDPAKIGVTGISGGGAATFWIAAADDRVKVAVPVSGMSDLECYVKNKVINGHCDCMFLYNTYQWDWTTIAAHGRPAADAVRQHRQGPDLPDGRQSPHHREADARSTTCTSRKPEPASVDEYVSAGGHDYRPDLRIAIFKFFNKHLKGDTTTKVEDSAKYTPLKGRELRVFPEDADVPKDALNGRIDETFIPAAKVALPEKGKFAEWKKGMIAKLRGPLVSAFDPEKIPAAKLAKVRSKRYQDVTGDGERDTHAASVYMDTGTKGPEKRRLCCCII